MSQPDPGLPDSGLSDEEQTDKDVSYSPGSESETNALQHEQASSPALDDVDKDAVRTLPGTGGPDDNGETDVPDADIHVPRDSGAH